jgi:outer membrane protein TolC
MRRRFMMATLLAASTVPSAAQTPQPATLHLTVDDAIRMALDHNPDLAATRLDPAIGDAGVAAAAASFRPTFNSSLQRNDQYLPAASLLTPVATRSDTVTSDAGLSQRLSRFGTNYSLGWSTIHTNSDSVLNTFNPLLQSGLAINVSQPLLRDLRIDAGRQQLSAGRLDRHVADVNVCEQEARTTAAVKDAYWHMLSAIAMVGARQSAVDLAEELVRVNHRKVDTGTAPPLDLVAAEAEVASDREQLIVAETAVGDAEDRLRTIIFDPADASMWSSPLELTDTPLVEASRVNVDAAVATALQERADLDRERSAIEWAHLDVRYAQNQRLPDVRLSAGYLASGVGGTQVLRSGVFPGTVQGTGATTTLGTVLNQLLGGQYPTWTAGVTVSYPIGASTEDARYLVAKLELAQRQAHLKGTEAEVVRQVREAGRKIEMNARRIETARAARQWAAERLESERRRLEVGMSTNFLVIQAQRDFVQAKANEIAAVLDDDLALVDFERVQRIGSNKAVNQSGATSSTPALQGLADVSQ